MSNADVTAAITRLEDDHGPCAPMDLATMPAQWRPIAESDDPEYLIPDYRTVLTTKLLDVRACEFEALGWVLVYLVDSTDRVSSWIGRDPAGFGDSTPVFWDCLPAPVRTFLRDVHAGYTSSYGFACGLTHPGNMITLADKWGGPEGLPEWLEETWFLDCDPIDARRTMYLTETSDTVQLVVSPDLPEGKALVYADSEARIVDLADKLQDFMCSGT